MRARYSAAPARVREDEQRQDSAQQPDESECVALDPPEQRVGPPVGPPPDQRQRPRDAAGQHREREDEHDDEADEVLKEAVGERLDQRVPGLEVGQLVGQERLQLVAREEAEQPAVDEMALWVPPTAKAFGTGRRGRAAVGSGRPCVR